MQLRQSAKGYRYNTDSILLYGFASRSRLRGKLLDAGCGCGIVGLLLARDFGLELTGVDILEESIAYARENAAANGLRARFFAGDVCEFDAGEKYDAIVCNPPFYNAKTTRSADESLRRARYADAMPIEKFLSRSGRLLKSDGDLFFCYDALETARLFASLAASRWHIRQAQFVHADPEKSARLVFFRVKKSPVRASEILPPIFLRDENGAIDAKLKAVSKRAATKCAN